jgi:hypothetical protein
MSTKRPAEKSQEEEEKAERSYVKLYNNYKESGENPSVVPELEELFGKLSLESQSKYKDSLPCHNTIDPLSEEFVSTLEDGNKFYLMRNNIKYCFNLDFFAGYVNVGHVKSPQITIPAVLKDFLSAEDLKRFERASNARLLVLWERFQQTTQKDVLLQILKILPFYKVKSDVIEKAKSDRLKKEMKNMDLTDICSMLEKYPLLNILGLTLDMIPWESIQDPSGCSDELKKLFKTKDELKSAFLDIPSFQAFLKRFESVAQSLLQAFFPRKVLLAPKKNYFYNLKLSFLDYYLSFPKTGKKFLVVPKENQTLQQAYKKAYRTHYSIDLLGLPNERNLVSEQWLAFYIYWDVDEDEGNDEHDADSLFTNKLPWWPNYPDLEETNEDIIHLVIDLEYLPPHFEIDFNFLDFAKNIQPPSISASMINGNDILKPWEELKKWFSKWPQNWTFPYRTSASDYKLRIDLIKEGNRLIDTAFSNNITIPPAKELWELFQKKDVFTKLWFDMTYKIVINLMYVLDNKYEYKDEIETLQFWDQTIPSQSKISPSDWINRWESKEKYSKNWLQEYFVDGKKDVIASKNTAFQSRLQAISNDGPNGRILRDIANLNDTEYSTSIINRVNKGNPHVVPMFITQYVRRAYNTQNEIVFEAIILAINYTIQKKNEMLYINYITRFWQGIDFQLNLQERDNNTYERVSSDILFKQVLENAKRNNLKLLKIEIASEGSLQLLKRHLLPKFNKLWHRPLKKTDTMQYFPLKYLEIPICSQCSLNIAAVAWENTSHYFCGEECARKKWESF